MHQNATGQEFEAVFQIINPEQDTHVTICDWSRNRHEKNSCVMLMQI